MYDKRILQPKVDYGKFRLIFKMSNSFDKNQVTIDKK